MQENNSCSRLRWFTVVLIPMVIVEMWLSVKPNPSSAGNNSNGGTKVVVSSLHVITNAKSWQMQIFLLKEKFAAADASQANDLGRQNWHLLQFSSAKTVRYSHSRLFTGESKMTCANMAAANTLSGSSQL